MKFIRQLGIILSITYIGEIMTSRWNLIIPGSVVGIIVLFLLLQFKALKVESVEDTGQFLLKHLPIMFVPLGVGVYKYIEDIKDYVGILLLIVAVTTIIVMVVSGWSVQLLSKGGRDHDVV